MEDGPPKWLPNGWTLFRGFGGLSLANWGEIGQKLKRPISLFDQMRRKRVLTNWCWYAWRANQWPPPFAAPCIIFVCVHLVLLEWKWFTYLDSDHHIQVALRVLFNNVPNIVGLPGLLELSSGNEVLDLTDCPDGIFVSLGQTESLKSFQKLMGLINLINLDRSV